MTACGQKGVFGLTGGEQRCCTQVPAGMGGGGHPAQAAPWIGTQIGARRRFLAAICERDWKEWRDRRRAAGEASAAERGEFNKEQTRGLDPGETLRAVRVRGAGVQAAVKGHRGGGRSRK